MTFTIETNVPMPKIARGRVAAAKFPLAEMDVGESFLIPCDINDKKTLESWRRKVLMAKKRVEDAEFKTFRVADGLRVFCVSVDAAD